MKKIVKQQVCDKCRTGVPLPTFRRLPYGWARVSLKLGRLKSRKYDLCGGCLHGSKAGKAFKDLYRNHHTVMAWVSEQSGAFKKTLARRLQESMIRLFVSIRHATRRVYEARNKLPTEQSTALPKKSA